MLNFKKGGQMPKPMEIHKYPTAVDSFFKDKRTVTSVVGKAIISQRLKRIGALAPNGQPIEIARAILIKRGQLVPDELRGIQGLKLGLRGIASESYSDGWCQSHWNQGSGWGDTWGECWDNSTSNIRLTDSVIVFNTLRNSVKAFSLKEFTKSELKIISSFGIIN